MYPTFIDLISPYTLQCNSSVSRCYYHSGNHIVLLCFNILIIIFFALTPPPLMKEKKRNRLCHFTKKSGPINISQKLLRKNALRLGPSNTPLRKLVDRALQNSIELYRELYKMGLQKNISIELYRKCYRTGLQKIISIEFYRIDLLFVIIFIS